MNRKYPLVAILFAISVSPTFAATTTPPPAPVTADTYFVSQDVKTLKCYVVTKIGPNGSQIGGTGYLTKAAAKTAMMAAPECKKK